MTPNENEYEVGGFELEDMNGHYETGMQSRTFREVMEEAIEAMQSAAESDVLLSDFIDTLLDSSDVPDKAMPFIEQLGDFRDIIRAFGAEYLYNEEKKEIDREATSDMIKNIESSCDNLLAASETNLSLKKFSERICGEVRLALVMFKDMLDQAEEAKAEETESLISALDDLFREEQRHA